MDMAEIRQFIANTAKRLADFRGSLDLERKEERIAELDERMASPDFWNDQKEAQKVISEAKHLKDQVNTFYRLNEKIEDIRVAFELLQEEPDPDLQEELEEQLEKLEKELNEFELELLLNGPYDKNNAILEIHSGAGGTESQDWASMLLRMYTRWAEKKGYQVEILDYLAGEEAGIKSVTLLIKGHNAYGYLKAEKGIHRLVRISPFDASGRRHTSFASCEVIPEINDDIEIEIRPEDIRVDTFRASGAGGQHVNKTSSAVRITHIPTGIVVSSQAQRSQIQNREQAMKMLRAKLYQKQLEEQEKQLAEIRGEQKEIGWGSQIRSYVFHPYSMVKDHRTNVETGNVQAVLDGEIDEFIDAYLRSQIQ
ncbi:MAG: peptide chain release factor 2 [Caldibacillus sp.]